MLAIGVAQILTYFDGAEESDSPVCFQKKDWAKVKTNIVRKINHQFK